MFWGRLIAACWLAGLFAGCASTVPLRLGLKLAPAALGKSLSLQQRLTVERDGRVEQFESVLEVDSNSVRLVILMLSQRMLSLSYDGQQLDSWRHPLVPSQLKAEDVLEDLQLTLWPADAIRRALPEGWQIEERGVQRTLRFDGAPIIVIDYDQPVRWGGKLTLTNQRYGYRITIESVHNL